MSKNDFFYMGPGGTQDHRGPHKTPKNPKKKKQKTSNKKRAPLGAPGEGWGWLEAL